MQPQDHQGRAPENGGPSGAEQPFGGDVRGRLFRSFLGSNAIKFLIQFVALAGRILVARLMTRDAPDVFGIYAQGLLIFGIIAALQNFGMTRHCLRQSRPSYGTFLGLNLGTSLMAGLALFAGADLFAGMSPHLPFALRILAVALPVTALGEIPNQYLTRELKIERMVSVELVATVIFLVVAVVTTVISRDLYCLVWSNLAAAVARTVMLWWVAGREIPLKWSRSEVWPLLAGGSRLFSLSLLYILYHRLDIAIISSYLPASDVGFWNMAMTLTTLVVGIMEPSFSQVLYPLFARYRDDPDRLRRAFQTCTYLVMAVEVPAYAFLMINFESLTVWALGPQWALSGRLAQALCLYAVLDPFTMFGQFVLMARGRDWPLNAASLGSTVIMAALGFILIPRFGLNGMVAARYGMLLAGLFVIIPVTRELGARNVFVPQLLALYLSVPVSLAVAWLLPAGPARFIASSVVMAVALAAGLWRVLPVVRGFLRPFLSGSARPFLAIADAVFDNSSTPPAPPGTAK